MKLYLIRHGQTKANIDLEQFAWDNNCPINDTGRQEVIKTANLLKSWNVKPTHLISSPLIRTQQTADIIGKYLGTTAQLNDRLHEVNVGSWGNRTCAAVYDYIEALPILQRFTFSPPGGESWQAAGERLASVASDYITDQEIILVSHFTPLQCGIGSMLKTSFEDWNSYDFPNASISLLIYENDVWKTEFIGRSPSGYTISEIKKRST